MYWWVMSAFLASNTTTKAWQAFNTSAYMGRKSEKGFVILENKVLCREPSLVRLYWPNIKVKIWNIHILDVLILSSLNTSVHQTMLLSCFSHFHTYIFVCHLRAREFSEYWISCRFIMPNDILMWCIAQLLCCDRQLVKINATVDF